MTQKDGTIAGYKVHPAASCFPMMTGHAFADLVADIKRRGLEDPIVVINDTILDGRNRAKACAEAGVEPRFKQYEGDDPIGFVVSHNLRRRHMSESERSMAAAKLATLGRGGDRGNQHTGGKLPTDSLPVQGLTQAEAARAMNVGTVGVVRGRKVLTKGVPELVEAVEAGGVAVSAAADVADLSPEQQREVLRRANGNPRAVRSSMDGVMRESNTETKPRRPHKSQPSTDPAVAARDEEIVAVFLADGGQSTGETARLMNLPRAIVQDAIRRAGLSRKQKADRDPLRGMVENANASEFGWRIALDSPAWASASVEQRVEALTALEAAVAAGRKLASKVKRMVQEEREAVRA